MTPPSQSPGNGEYLAADAGGLSWGPLVQGLLMARRQRFLADVLLDDGRQVTAHCANTGTMRACGEPGRPVYLSTHDRPNRKLPYTWELIRMPEALVGVNTGVPVRLLRSALGAGLIPALAGYAEVRPEVKTSEGSRLDLLLQEPGRRPCHVEVKNCTLVEDGVASFPDAVTARGRKHMGELERLVRAGGRAVVFFLIQRGDARVFGPADRIDPEYGRALRAALRAGVEALAYDVTISLARIDMNGPVPMDI